MIWLVRHGQTEMNSVGRFQGRLDSPLTPLGEAQARRVGAQLRALAADLGGVWAIDASPLGRTRRTAALPRSRRSSCAAPTARVSKRSARGCGPGWTMPRAPPTTASPSPTLASAA